MPEATTMNPILQKIYISVLKEQESIICFKQYGLNTYTFYITYQQNPNVVRPYLIKPGLVLADPKSIYTEVDGLEQISSWEIK